MAWRVDVDSEEFSKKFDYGPKGPKMMGNISVSDPRLSPDQVPPRVVISGKVSKCAWFVMAFGGGTWIVSERFKDIVEGLEPGIHNWLPTDLVLANGDPTPEPYYFFQVGQTLDSVIFERSSFNSIETVTGEHAVFFPKLNHLMTLEKQKVAGKHVWKEKFVGHIDFFFSNDLVGILKKLGLKKCFKLFDCREESAP
jgi:hypothetical protein